MTGSLITRAQHESHQGKLRAAPRFSEPNKGRNRERKYNDTNREDAPAPNYEETRRKEKENNDT